jgi:hypothetical protein
VVLAEQVQKASFLVSKYEILTREYHSQSKSLKENHEKIIAGEQTKRQEIIANFETHLS